jgi:hypothetical protein
MSFPSKESAQLLSSLVDAAEPADIGGREEKMSDEVEDSDDEARLNADASLFLKKLLAEGRIAETRTDFDGMLGVAMGFHLCKGQ